MAPSLMVTARESLAEMAQRFVNAMKPDGTPRPMPGAGPVPSPAAPLETLPRSQVIPFGYNTGMRPRAGTGLTLTPFEQLRSLADFDLVRAAVEDIRSQVRGMRWEIRVRPDFKGQEQRLQGRLSEVRAFCEAPDALAGIEWPEFCGSVVEEILVTDALTLLPRRDLGGRLIGIEQIDGATIIPFVDDRGRPPLPPAVAFAQVVHGVIETEFRLGELLYLPRNRRASNPFGRSCVENVLFAANLAIRNNLYDLSFFSAGNIPDGGFWKCPDDWTPDDIEKAQARLDDIARGNTEKRSGYLKLMPGGAYVSTKDRKWDYEFMEWLARVISWGFGVSPIPIAKQMNRATGQTMEESSLEAGTRPVADFVADVMNRVLKSYGGVTEVEFAFSDDESQDPTVVYQRAIAFVAAGIMDVNEARQTGGLEPYDFETPAMRDTPSGPQLLEQLIEDLQNPPEPPPQLAPKPPNGTGQDEGAPPADIPPPPPADAEPTAQEKAWAAAFTKYRAAVVVDLRKWREVAIKRAKEGRIQKLAFKSNVIPRWWLQDVAAGVSSCTKRFSDRASVEAGFKLSLSVFKGELKPTRARAKVEKTIVAMVHGWLSDLEPKVLSWAFEQLPAEKIAKTDLPDFDAGGLADDLASQLEAGGGVGAAEAAQAIGVNLERVPPEVITYARQRAGELVGKRYVAGQWVDSVSGFAISDTLRGQVTDAVSRAIEESWTPAELASTLKGYFEISRAQTIARTETALSYGNGAAELYKAEGVDQVNVVDGPGCLPFGHDDGAPQPSGDPGTIESDAQADGQVWTVREYQGAVIGHPNCCVSGQKVLAHNVTATMARRFRGEVIVLRTAADDLLTCTPNHPVLTDTGWRPAESVRKGDRVLRCIDLKGIAALLNPHDQHGETEIQELVRSLVESSGSPPRRVPLTPEDFHGDGSNDEVDIVDIDGLAGFARGSEADNHLLERDLGDAPMGLCPLLPEGAGSQVGIGSLHPSDSIVSGPGALRPSLRPDAGQVELEALRLAAHVESSPSEAITQPGAVSPELLGDDVNALAGLVALVQVEDVTRTQYVGHVFNLETAQGWYVAGGIVTHNCVRVATPYFTERKEL